MSRSLNFYSCGRKRLPTDLATLGPCFSCECGRVHQTTVEETAINEVKETTVYGQVGTVATTKGHFTRLKIELSIWWTDWKNFWKRLFLQNEPETEWGDPQELTDQLFPKEEADSSPQRTTYLPKIERLSLVNLTPEPIPMPHHSEDRQKLLRLLQGNQERLDDFLGLYRKNHPTMPEADRIDKAIIDLERDRR